jgi:hypothetical protein
MAESRGGAVGGLSPTVVVTPDLRLWEWLWLSFPTNLQRNNLVKINWHRNEKCCFFIIMNLYNISVLIVFSLNSFGE